jgi:hypothetical protein
MILVQTFSNDLIRKRTIHPGGWIGPYTFPKNQTSGGARNPDAVETKYG